MVVRENERHTKDYFDPELRYIGNSVQVFFKDGTSTGCIAVDLPIGHRERREEGIPVLKQKFVDSVSPKLAANQWDELNALCTDSNKLAASLRARGRAPTIEFGGVWRGRDADAERRQPGA